MDDLQFSIVLNDGKPLSGGLPIYAPGDRVTGSVQIVSNKQINCRGVKITAGWYTEGKGARDQTMTEVMSMDVRRIEVGVPIGQRFSFGLPMFPYSYAGQLITINWVIRAKIDRALKGDPMSEQKFILSPIAPR